jgi:hypothetical protein
MDLTSQLSVQAVCGFLEAGELEARSAIGFHGRCDDSEQAFRE